MIDLTSDTLIGEPSCGRYVCAHCGGCIWIITINTTASNYSDLQVTTARWGCNG